MRFDVSQEDFAKYLIELKYLPAGADEPEQFAHAIEEFQKDMLLPVTGEADDVTRRAAVLFPRCGVTDAPAARGQESRWGLKHLRYFIESRPEGPQLSRAEYDQAVRLAFDSITACCGLTFEAVTRASDANIVLKAARGSRAGFDGPSGTLAYAYLPSNGNYTGQLVLVMDMDESWVVSAQMAGIIVIHVLRHELGHILGLEHTRTPGQLLLPTYSARIPTFQTEDIARLQAKYGKPTVVTPPVVPPVIPVDPTKPDRIGARVQDRNGKIYAGWCLPEDSDSVRQDVELLREVGLGVAA